jgi:RNA recognition motif-containing protein
MITMFIRNLAPDTREDDVRELFAEFGTVRGLKLVMDVFSGKCRGFATVDMEGHEARAAMAGLNGRTYKGQSLKVAEERKDKGRGGPRRR